MRGIKKGLSIVLTVVFVLSSFLIPSDNFALEAKAEEQEIIPSGFTPIYTFEDLYAVRNDLDGKYILMNDIDMTEETAPGGDWDVNGFGWLPIGKDEYSPFTGVFNGNGHSVIGMNIHGEISYEYVGLFGCVDEGEIYDLKMEATDIEVACTGYTNIGIVAGRFANGRYYKCFTSGNVNCANTTYQNYIGGHIGLSYSNIYDCYSIANLYIQRHNNTGNALGAVGGIVGICSTPGVIQRCYFAGTLAMDKPEDEFFGMETICGDGMTYKGSDCYYLLGSCPTQVSTTNCMGLSVGQMKSKAAFTNWNFENTWVFDPTGSYKYPQLRDNMHIEVTEIELLYEPLKTTYNQGEGIDPEGAYIRVFHEDDSVGDIAVDASMILNYNPYVLGTQTVTINYLGATTTFEIFVKPGMVKNPLQTVQGTTSVELRWDDISGVDGYIVYCLQGNEWISITETSIAKCAITDLNPGSKYTYGVAAYIYIGNEQYIGPMMELDAYTSLDDVTGLNATSYITGVDLEWEELLGAEAYLVYQNTAGEWVCLGGVYEANAKISDLEADTTYLFGITGISVPDEDVKIESKLVTIRVTTKAYKKVGSYSLAISNATYNGKTWKPKVTVRNKSGEKLTQDVDYTVAYSGGKYVGKHKVTITMKGEYAGKKILYFTVNPPKSSVKKLTAAKKSLKVYLTKKSAQVSGYQIQYSTSKSFKSSKTKTLASYKSTSTTLKNLSAKKTYYVRVRTYKTVSGKKYYSDWSVAKYKKTK